MQSQEHIYRKGASNKRKKEFEKRYGRKKGSYVYGATVGKLKRRGSRSAGKRNNSGGRRSMRNRD